MQVKGFFGDGVENSFGSTVDRRATMISARTSRGDATLVQKIDVK